MLPAWLRRTAITMVAVMGLHSLAPLSYGSAIESAAISTETARAADLATIQKALEQKVVQHRLGELGFTTGEIQTRMELASNAELHQLAVQSDTLTAGGDGGIIAILLIVLLVLLILRITTNDTGLESDMLVA
jgi:hypothetical protein